MRKTERIQGSLLGLALGDILGSPVEGWPSLQIRTVFGPFDRLPARYPLARIAPFGPKTLRRLRPLGLHSDDTQQALALLQVCLSAPAWSLKAWASLLVEGMRQRAWRGYGRNFTASGHRLTNGYRPRH